MSFADEKRISETIARAPELGHSTNGRAPTQPRSRSITRWILLLAATALVIAVASRHIRVGEFDYNVDEAQHAVTGLYVADFCRDLPLRHPIRYTYRYYAQYPAVAIVHWPPFFYFFEAISFLLIGPTAVAARLAILFFTLLLLYHWFALVEEWHDSYTAAICAALLGLLPMIVLFEKTVMLEIPSLALSVATIRYWIRYLERTDRKSLYIAALWLSAALLCKETCVFLIPFCVLSLIVTSPWKQIRWRDAIVFTAIVTVLAAPFLTLMLVVHGKSFTTDLGPHLLTGWAKIFYYSQVLADYFPAKLLLLALMGLVLGFRWDSRRRTAIMCCWVLSAYFTITWFGQGDKRFAIYWLPPLVYFAVGLLTQFFHRYPLRVAMRAAAALLVAIMAIPAWQQQRPYISGYKNVAAKLVNEHRAGIVLFDGRVPGNFVFFMRALDPSRRFVTLRKLLYVDNIRQGPNSQELLRTREEVSKALEQVGVRYIVVSQPFALRFDDQRFLREHLQGDEFRLMGRFPVVSNEPKSQGEALLLYEKKKWTAPPNGTLKIRMLTIAHDIEFPLSEFKLGGK